MKFSVITVCFNSSQTVKKTMSSVLSQRNVDLEYIIIDGGSSDGTIDIINQFNHERLILVSEKDKGIYDAINKGLSIAIGDYVVLLHADDYWDSNLYLSAMQSELGRTQAMVAYSNVKFFSSRKNKVVRTWVSSTFRKFYLLLGWMPPHTSLILNKEVVNDIGHYRLDLGSASDFDYCLKVFNKYGERSVHVKDNYVMMRLGGVSTKSIDSIKNNILCDYRILRLRYSVPLSMFALIMKRLIKAPQFIQ